MAVSTARDSTICARMAEFRTGLSGKGVTHMHRNRLGGPVHIRGGEAEQTKAGTDKAILPAIVINHPVAMTAAVVFDRQALNPIKQVGTT